jgi:Zn-dependent protease
MLPFPPLDGSKILSALLPYPLSVHYQKFVRSVEQYGIFVMFAFIFIFINFFSGPFFIFVSGIVELLTGISA